MRGMVESINLSVSVGVILGEVTRQRIGSGKSFTFSEPEQVFVEMLLMHKRLFHESIYWSGGGVGALTHLYNITHQNKSDSAAN